MLDFKGVREGRLKLDELVADLTLSDLRRLTGEMVTTMLSQLEACTDADVGFVPDDPAADDPFATDAEDEALAWTLGHVIAHVTASAEESAFLAAELARGVAHHGRSRYEVPWQGIQTVAQCRHRLEESRRMRLATLDIWPDQPHMDNHYESRSGRRIGPVLRFVYGLKHDADHLDQIAEIVRQARQAREPVTPA